VLYVCAWCAEEFTVYRKARNHEQRHRSPVGVFRHHRQREANMRMLMGVEHGKRSSYVKGCRCHECRDAEAVYSYAYKHRRNGR
jgi:hypothetical protein